MRVSDGLRHGLFSVASVLSTTGYAAMSYESWLSFTIGLMILLMPIGGSLGSTAGSLKLTRVYLILG